MGKLSKDRRDIYYRKAKEDGYRARSAYKLLQLDDEYGIFDAVTSKGSFRVVDLCAAPGSWSQVISQRLEESYKQALERGIKNLEPPLIVAVDLQEMAPIKNVITIQGDITSKETADQIISYFKGSKADVVVCDGAPDVTGMHDIDEYIQSQLLFAALRTATMLLAVGSTFIAKIFRGELAGIQFAQLELFFNEVLCCKPASSRVSSFEGFVICRGFRQPIGFNPSEYSSYSEFKDAVWECATKKLDKKNATSEENAFEYLRQTIVSFVACGDLNGGDADTTYYLEEPTQKPTNPPYLLAVQKKRDH